MRLPGVLVPRKNRFGLATGSTWVFGKPLATRMAFSSAAGQTSPHSRTAVSSETVSRVASTCPRVTLLGYAPSRLKMPSPPGTTIAAVTSTRWSSVSSPRSTLSRTVVATAILLRLYASIRRSASAVTATTGGPAGSVTLTYACQLPPASVLCRV